MKRYLKRSTTVLEKDVLDHDCHIVDMVYYGNTMARSFTADCRTRKDVNESGNLQLP